MVSNGDGKGLIDWYWLLHAWLHDPIDKALDIRGHEARAARYASRALDSDVLRKELKDSASLADQLAAIAERIPMPTAGQNGERAVGPENGQIEVRHPVSARPAVLKGLVLDEASVGAVIDSIVAGLPDDPRTRFLALWRLFPERVGLDLARLPADTRVPDHTLIQHADITSGIWASQQGARGGAYLSLSLGPVQKFIEAARSVRDLWSGSAILSWLIFQGIRPVIEKLGPDRPGLPGIAWQSAYGPLAAQAGRGGEHAASVKRITSVTIPPQPLRRPRTVGAGRGHGQSYGRRLHMGGSGGLASPSERCA